MIQVISQTFLDIFGNAPNVVVPLPQIMLMTLLLCLSTLFELYRAAVITAFGFLINWVFIQNFNLLSLNMLTIITVLLFLALGVFAALSVCHQALTR